MKRIIRLTISQCSSSPFATVWFITYPLNLTNTQLSVHRAHNCTLTRPYQIIYWVRCYWRFVVAFLLFYFSLCFFPCLLLLPLFHCFMNLFFKMSFQLNLYSTNLFNQIYIRSICKILFQSTLNQNKLIFCSLLSYFSIVFWFDRRKHTRTKFWQWKIQYIAHDKFRSTEEKNLLIFGNSCSIWMSLRFFFQISD